METNVKKFFLKTLENQYNVRIFRKNDVLRCFEKQNGVKFPQNGILRVWKPRLVFWSHTTSLSPATVDQRTPISVFSNRLPAPLDARPKRSCFFSRKWIEILSQTETLSNFYLVSPWQSLLTAIWFSRLKISRWFFIRLLSLNSEDNFYIDFNII